MKKVRWIQMLLASAAICLEANAATTVTPGYVYYDDLAQGSSDAEHAFSTNGTDYVAVPPAGRQVSNWGWATTGSAAQQSKGVNWADPSVTALSYSIAGIDTAEKAAVRFVYIPLTVSFKGNGGTGTMSSITGKNIDSSFTLTANAFKKTGYHFDQWKNDLSKSFADKAKVKGSDFWDTVTERFHSELTAQWEPNAYTVRFNGNGATEGTMADESFTYDQSQTLTSNAFEKTGYAFAGWATNATEGAVLYGDKKSVKNLTAVNNEVVNLYARWTQKYTVTFREDEKFKDTTPGGDGILKAEYVLSGGSATPPVDPQHTGYRFTGWNGKYDVVTKDENVYATYQANTYRVILHSNYGADETSEEEFTYGEAKKLLPMSRTGYALKGWAESAESGEVKYKPEESVANLATEGSIHLYALWTPITYSVAFDSNGGEGEMASAQLTYDVEYVVPECAFTKKGCEFQSWQLLVEGKAVTNYAAGAVVSNLTSVAGATVTFKADWTGFYTIAFDGNGGEGEMADARVEIDVGYQLPSNVFARTGYDFVAWSTNRSASASSTDLIADAATVTNLAEVGETCTLYVIWDPHRYTISFDGNGGKGTNPKDMDCTYGEEMSLPTENPYELPKNYAIFSGWSTNKNDTTGAYVVSNLTAEADGRVTVYAIWQYDVGDWSRVLDCNNLKFENMGNCPWKIETDSAQPESDSCLTQIDQQAIEGGDPRSGMLRAEVTESGTFSFWYKGEGGGADYPNEFYVRLSENEDAGWPPGEDLASKSLIDDLGWTYCEVDIEVPAGEKRYVWFAHADSIPVSVDCVTWKPVANPEPTEDDAVTIGTASVADGKFKLSFASDARFDYNLLTNADLTVDSWGVMQSESGTGEEIVFEPTIDASQPQLFYKVETIQKRD